MSKPVSYNAGLVGRTDLSDTLAIFRVRPDDVPPAERPWFEPGQYVSLGLNASDTAAWRGALRPYSVASEPEERRWLEFYIRRAAQPESPEPFTPMLWEVPEGGRLYSGPKVAGRFTETHTVGRDDPRLRVCVAAGTGIAPFVSTARSAARSGRDGLLRRLVLLHGASHVHELGYRDELEALVPRGLRYFPTVSRPQANPGWGRSTGRVERFFDEAHIGELEEALGLAPDGFSPEQAVVYVCGFTGTISATVLRLLRRGFVPEDRRLRRLVGIAESARPSLFYEQYDTTPIVDPKDEARLAELRAEVRARVAGADRQA